MHSHGTQGDGETVLDPVCGMRITPGKLRAEHAGNTFFFCNPKCQSKFVTDPARYVAGTKPQLIG